MIFAVAVGAVLVAAAWIASPRAIQAGDAGEFATVMLRGGVPHPSGYPWMRVLGGPARILEKIGLASAKAAALPCALAGAAAWILAMVLALGLARGTGTGRTGNGPIALLTLHFALAASILVHVADSEVWGPHLLFTALVVRAGLRRLKPSAPPAPGRLGFVLGLATSHHLTAVLLTPLVVGAAWPRRTSVANLARTLALGLTGVGVGLLPYFTLALGDGPWQWGETGSLDGLVRHVTRAEYGVFSLSLHAESPPTMALWGRAFGNLATIVTAGTLTTPWFGAAFVATVVAVALPTPVGIRPSAWWGYLATFAASALLFPALQNIDPSPGPGSWILERFDILTAWLLLPLTAVALSRALARSNLSLTPVVATIALGLGLLVQVARTATGPLPRNNDSIERYATDVLNTPAPPRSGGSGPALIFGTDDHRLFPLLYATEVLRQPSHAVYIDASLLSLPWYRAHVRRRWPDMPDIDKPLRLMGHLWNDAARRDVPIYLSNVFSRPASELRMVPEGVLLRVVPPHANADDFDLDAVVTRHRAALARYRGVIAEDAQHDPFAGSVVGTYTRGTSQLMDALRADGYAEDAEILGAEVKRLLSRPAG